MSRHTVERANRTESKYWNTHEHDIDDTFCPRPIGGKYTKHTMRGTWTRNPDGSGTYNSVGDEEMVWGSWSVKFYRGHLSQEILEMMGIEKDPYDQYIEDVKRNGRGNYDADKVELELEKQYDHLWNLYADKTDE